MGFYPNMGVLATVDGAVYTCQPFLRNVFKEYWNASQASKVEFELKRYHNLWRLSIRFQDTRTFMFLGNSSEALFQPDIKCVMWKLMRIQNAVRNWLHRRKTPPREQAMLFLRTSILADVAGAVERAMQLHL